MADRTKIEGTDVTSNPVTSCFVVSPGCAHCCAMHPDSTRLQPRMIFVQAHGGLFLDSVPDEWIDRVQKAPVALDSSIAADVIETTEAMVPRDAPAGAGPGIAPEETLDNLWKSNDNGVTKAGREAQVE